MVAKGMVAIYKAPVYICVCTCEVCVSMCIEALCLFIDFRYVDCTQYVDCFYGKAVASFSDPFYHQTFTMTYPLK